MRRWLEPFRPNPLRLIAFPLIVAGWMLLGYGTWGVPRDTSSLAARIESRRERVRYWAAGQQLAVAGLVVYSIDNVLNKRYVGRHMKPGLCAACGYDMRATPDRCPECGAAAVKEAEKGP